MLELITGGTADGDDRPARVQQRIQKMYALQYIQG
jgi:hypothetical protein